MARDLEGLIAELVVFVACGGDRGCSIAEVLEAADARLGHRPNPVQGGPTPAHQSQDDSQALHNTRAHSTVWRWLSKRPELSVGRDREFNSLSLDQVHRASRGATQNNIDPTLQPNDQLDQDGQSSPHQEPRIYATNEAQWDFIAGHSQDFTRVLQLEWQLLQGVATTRLEGILQGDLCRLVNQDKRSVPKRTDALVKKGYLTKRTTLIRGTKTSKLWLRSLAPSIGKDDEDPGSIDLSKQSSQHKLTTDLEAVPWSHQWTGQSLDFAALSTTIMAVTKQWGVIRMHDLKLKLGILSMRWHMKVLAKICRILNRQGAIRYTAATLDGRVYKDCVQYVRDLVQQDLAVLFASGKHREQPLEPSYDIDKQDSDQEDNLITQGVNATPLVSLPPWNLDKPLTPTVTDIIAFFGATGATNPEVISLSLGPSFSRFITTLTFTFSANSVQPEHLKHLQMTSEHKREGKVASYRYFIQPSEGSRTQASQDDVAGAANSDQNPSAERYAYGFVPNLSRGLGVTSLVSLTGAARCLSATAKQLGIQRSKKAVTTEPEAEATYPTQVEEQPTKDTGRPRRPGKRRKSADLRPMQDEPITDKELSPLEAHAEPSSKPQVQVGEPGQLALQTSAAAHGADEFGRTSQNTRRQRRSTRRQSSEPTATNGTGGEGLAQPQKEESDGENDRADHEEPAKDNIEVRPRRGRGGLRGRGRGKRGKATVVRTGVKPYVCEKCGGSWKNDIGLKYHQEKAKTPCNPSYDPTQETPRRARKPKQAAFELNDDLQESLAPAQEGNTDTGRRELRQRQQSRVVLSDSEVDENDPSSLMDAESATYVEPFVTSLDHKSGSRKRPEKGVKKMLGAHAPVSATKTRGAGGALLPAGQMISRHVPTNDRNVGDPEVPPGLQSKLPTLSEVAQTNRSTAGIESQLNAEDAAHNGPEVPETAVEPWTAASNEGPNPSGDARSSRKLTRSEMAKKVAAILEKCFHSDTVVLPGGDVIHRIIQADWAREHAEQRQITPKECQSALRILFKNKVVAEHWHAFRNKSGSFSKCQTITRPDVDPNSSVCLELVEKIKINLPRLYFPEGFEYASDFHGVGISGRRNLPSEIAVLNAPVYAAQIAVKRANDVEEPRTPRPRKRRRWDSPKADHSLDRQTSPTWVANSMGSQWMLESHRSLDMYHGVDFRMAMASASFEHEDLRFLEPNTYLEEEEPAQRGGLVGTTTQRMRHTADSADISPAEYFFVESTLVIRGPLGKWPYFDSQDFEDDGLSFTMEGWIPDPAWHTWASRAKQLAKPPKASAGVKSPSQETKYQKFRHHLKRVEGLEVSREKDFTQATNRAAGPNNIFVPFQGPTPQLATPQNQLRWVDDMPEDEVAEVPGSSETDSDFSDSGEAELKVDPRLKDTYKGVTNTRLTSYANLLGVKRVLLTTRNLTAISVDANKEMLAQTHDSDDEGFADQADEPAELLAAFIAVRALLGGVEKMIDWGILLDMFPGVGLEGLQKFWKRWMNEDPRHISSYTQDFQKKFLEAYELGELPPFDYDDPASNDWEALIDWTYGIAQESSNDMPSSTSAFHDKFRVEEALDQPADWRNDFFHPQSSLFSRFGWAVSEPGAVSSTMFQNEISDSVPITDLVVIRSWVRSLCCAAEGRFSTQDIKDKFLSLSPEGDSDATFLLSRAIEELTQERVVRRNPKPPLVGRTFQLSEPFNTNLAKLTHRKKYLEAGACKATLDSVFRRGGTFRISYALGDGAIMAITSLNAAQRVVLRPVELPDIPLGFEPGNYESRKYPKNYYHFELEVVPTDAYMFDEDIEVLQETSRRGPAMGSSRGELPQWVNFAGEIDEDRWSSVLGAFCFALATRGPMTIEALCAALDPVLEPCEASTIIRWGKETGVLKSLISGVGTTVGEWWWLAVAQILAQGPGQSAIVRTEGDTDATTVAG